MEAGDEIAPELRELSRGPNRLRGIPAFVSFNEHRRHILIHMAALLRNWGRCGFTEGISGHITVRDPEFHTVMWMNPIGRHFSLLNASDMVCVRISDGEIVGGNRTRPINNPGYYIHSAVHRAREDVDAICHAHTIAGRAWCVFGEPLDMITQDICDAYGRIYVDTEYTAVATAEKEGDRIAKVLGEDGMAALLRNHGIVTVGHTIDEAGFLLGLVDRSCEIQLRVEAACKGNPKLIKRKIPDEQAASNFRITGGKDWLYEEAQPDIQMEIELAGGAISYGLENIFLQPQ